jgi:hypothetical protein
MIMGITSTHSTMRSIVSVKRTNLSQLNFRAFADRVTNAIIDRQFYTKHNNECV